MALPKSRGQIITPTDSIQLIAQFYDNTGSVVDLDAFPSITIVQPNGSVVLGPTSQGVYRLSTGTYGYTYGTSLGSDLGVYADAWTGTLGSSVARQQFNFVVYNTQMPIINTDGYVALGDDPGFNYSQNALRNINKVIKIIRARLKSAGKKRSFDQYGNPVFQDCDIFSIDQLATFAASSLTLFNEIPHFTLFTFEDTQIIDQFLDLVAQGGTIMALSSQALIERGREFNITDNGVGFTPPTVSEILNGQFGAELSNHMEKLKMIKASMKPSPLGLGGLRTMGAATAIMKLRSLRARQIL
jgi:hypothetical protein